MISRRNPMMKRIAPAAVLTVGMVLALAGCTNPYDPGQRAVGGGLLGAGAGAAIGAAVGGATGAVTGAATTPPPPPPGYGGYGGYGGPGYGYPPPPPPSGYGY